MRQNSRRLPWRVLYPRHAHHHGYEQQVPIEDLGVGEQDTTAMIWRAGIGGSARATVRAVGWFARSAMMRAPLNNEPNDSSSAPTPPFHYHAKNRMGRGPLGTAGKDGILVNGVQCACKTAASSIYFQLLFGTSHQITMRRDRSGIHADRQAATKGVLRKGAVGLPWASHP